MSTFHPDTVNQVRQAADIVEVIADKVVLRKQGKNYVGLCPFHSDRKPSFQVSSTKQIYKCFACGAGGDVIRFISQYDRISFSEAVLHLAQRYHLSVQASPTDQKAYQQKVSRQDQLLEILALATDFYQHALKATVGAPAQRYLHQRQLQPDTIQKFQIGFAPPGWEPLYDYLVKQKSQPVKLVEAAGLISARKSGRGWYDRFRHRVVLPIHNPRGQIVGFAGRTLGDDQPKYLNSPETELFNKGQLLYGLHHARDAIVKADQVLVVEGYFDVIALHQAGIANTVASMGTALGPDQIKQLLRYTESKRIVFNFDGDQAGLTAAERAIDTIGDQVRRGAIELRILTIPEGKDADEFLRHRSGLSFLELLDEAPLWLDWQIQQVLSHKQLNLASDFQQAYQALVKILAGLGGNWRSIYIHKVAELLSRGHGRLTRNLEEDLRRSVREHRWSKPEKTAPVKGSKLVQSESHLLQIFLHFTEFRTLIRQELVQRELQFNFVPHRNLWQHILSLIMQDRELETRGDTLLMMLRTTCAHDEILNQQLSHLLWMDENTRVALMRPKMVVRAAIANMELEIRQKRLRYWIQYWEQAYKSNDHELAKQYQDRVYEEQKAIEALQKDAQLSVEDLVQTPIADELV